MQIFPSQARLLQVDQYVYAKEKAGLLGVGGEEMSFDRPPFLLDLKEFADTFVGNGTIKAHGTKLADDINSALDLIEELFEQCQRLQKTVMELGRCRDIQNANADKRDAEQRQLIADLKNRIHYLERNYHNLREEYSNR